MVCSLVLRWKMADDARLSDDTFSSAAVVILQSGRSLAAKDEVHQHYSSVNDNIPREHWPGGRMS